MAHAQRNMESDDDDEAFWERSCAAVPAVPAAVAPSRKRGRTAASRSISTSPIVTATPPTVHFASSLSVGASVWGTGDLLGAQDPDACDMLRGMHPHPADHEVRFVEHGHKYSVSDGKGGFVNHKGLFSVSSVWPRCQQPFQRDLFASRSATANTKKLVKACTSLSRNPSFHELTEAFGASAAAKCRSTPDFMQLVEDSCSNPKDRAVLAGVLAETYPREFEERFVGFTPGRVISGWTAAGVHGTDMHLQVERFYNKVPHDTTHVEMSHLWPAVLNQYPEIAPDLIWRTELSMYYAPLFLCGQLDMLYRSTDNPGMFKLGDLKVCKDIHKPATLAEDFKAAFPKFKATKATCYGLQLNLYRFMLSWYGYECDEMFIICLHKTHEGPRKIPIEFMPKETVWLLEKHEERLKDAIAKGAGWGTTQ